MFLKRIALLFSFCLIFSTYAVAEDIEVFGEVGVNVKPNVMIILDNSPSMNKVEGPIGNFDSSKEYEGVYDERKVYYISDFEYNAATLIKGDDGKPITDPLRFILPDHIRTADIANIDCEDFKNELSLKGQSHRDAYLYPGEILKCQDSNESLCFSMKPAHRIGHLTAFNGNYLNWFFYNTNESEYNKDTSYQGTFDPSKIYQGSFPSRPQVKDMGLNNARIEGMVDSGILKDIESKGRWSGEDVFTRNGLFSRNCSDVGGDYKPAIKACKEPGSLLTYLPKIDGNFYSANYLNWFFNRGGDSVYNSNKKYSGDFIQGLFYYFEPTLIKPDPVKNYAGDFGVLPEDRIRCADIYKQIADKGYYDASTCDRDEWVDGQVKAFYNCEQKITTLKDHRFYTGKYLNYYNERRISIAKRLIKEVAIDEDYSGSVRFGLMTFNPLNDPVCGVLEDGGNVVAPIQDDGNVKFLQALKAVKESERLTSPLAETLYDAGLYFAGEKRRFCPNNNDESPITNWCQKNHVIIITDGGSNLDSDHNLWLQPYINNKVVGDSDKDGLELGPFGRYLDDVAYFLRHNDIYKDAKFRIKAGEEKDQFITTHVIAYRLSALANLITQRRWYLEHTAKNGGGQYYEVDNLEALELELKKNIQAIMNDVSSQVTSYLTPIAPVDSAEMNYTGDMLYKSFFYPHDEGRWIGNIKKYKISKTGSISDEDEWSKLSAPEVDKGGIRSMLLNQNESDRQVLTNNDEGRIIPFSAETIDKEETKKADPNDPDITAPATWSDLNHARLIQDIRCGSSGDCKLEGLGHYALGDIIHFQPLIYDFKVGRRLFVGANDGMLHCFDEGSGLEKWAFIPLEQIKRLKNLTRIQVKKHKYYIDGGRTLYTNPEGKHYFIFGERRGGKNYYALDVTNPDSPAIPYEIDEIDESFGESWSNPRVVPVMYDKSTPKDVFWIGGGYDSDVQDKFDKNNQDVKPDNVGKGIYAIDASNGDMLVKVNMQGIENCILDPVSFNPGYRTDLRTDEKIKKTPGLMNAHIDAHSRVYASDMAGNLWGVRQDEDKIVSTDEMDTHMPGEKGGGWVSQKIFEPKKGKKVFHRPEVVLETFVKPKDNENPKDQRYYGEYVYFGTGDREHPNSIKGNNGNGDDKANPDDQNRLYAVKNCWDGTTAKEERDLKDVTEGQVGNSDLSRFSTKGWYIRLTGNGEKVVSYPVAYRGMVFFTTYTPSAEVKDHSPADPATPNPGDGPAIPATPANETEDPCATLNSVGVARLYALNYKSGAPVLNLHKNYDANGNEIPDPEPGKLTLSDRSVIIGSGMPGAPSLIFPKNGGSKIMVGVGNKIFTQDLNVRDMTVYYWKEKR